MDKNKKELVVVDHSHVSCEGSAYPYDHPKIYLEITKEKKQVECPYCSKTFKLDSK